MRVTQPLCLYLLVDLLLWRSQPNLPASIPWITVWVYGFLLYLAGYDLFLSFILLLRLFQVFPVDPASGWLLCYVSLSSLLPLPYFFLEQHDIWSPILLSYSSSRIKCFSIWNLRFLFFLLLIEVLFISKDMNIQFNRFWQLHTSE